MMKTPLTQLVWILLLLCACGDDATPAADAGEADGATMDDAGEADGSTSMFEPHDVCTQDDDCESASEHCVHFATGQSACRVGPQPPLACMPDAGEDCCDTECAASETCVAVTTQPVACSPTAGFDTHNRCLADECSTDDDCADGVCAPAGFDDARHCIAAACRVDADCTDEPGGACVVLDGGCCLVMVGGGTLRAPQLACAYPSDGCQSDQDCAQGTWCSTSTSPGRARCTTGC